MICVPIMARDNAEVLEKMEEASVLSDMIEIRLDVMANFDLREIVESAPKPVLVTYRSKREGGSGSVDYGTRADYLVHAIKAGADFIDVEFTMPLEFRRRIFHQRGACGIVLSAHLLAGTPEGKALHKLLRSMSATGADFVKIVTLATAWEDNLRILELIPQAQAMGVKIIAFCMGPLGRISRIASLLMGGSITFASLKTGQESASGQIPIAHMRKILEMLST